MIKKIKTQDSIVASCNDNVFNYFGWPSVAKLPDGTLAMVASGHRLGHVCPFGKMIICYSRDEGKTWSAPSALIDTPLDDRDGGIAVFGNGRVIVTSFNNTVEFQRNEVAKNPDYKYKKLIEEYLNCVDEEMERKYLGSTYRISDDGGYTFGEVKIAPVNAPHGPCPTIDGGLLYIGRYFAKECEGSRIQCWKLNENDEFEYLSTIEQIEREDYEIWKNVEPYAIMMPDGKIIVHIRLGGTKTLEDGSILWTDTIYQCESYDNGKTFTKPYPVGLEHGAPSHLCLHSSGVLISSCSSRLGTLGEQVMFSKDAGETWDMGYYLRDDGPVNDLGYPCTIERSDGSLLTVYYQKEKADGPCIIMQSIWELPEL